MPTVKAINRLYKRQSFRHDSCHRSKEPEITMQQHPRPLSRTAHKRRRDGIKPSDPALSTGRDIDMIVIYHTLKDDIVQHYWTIPREYFEVTQQAVQDKKCIEDIMATIRGVFATILDRRDLSPEEGHTSAWANLMALATLGSLPEGVQTIIAYNYEAEPDCVKFYPAKSEDTWVKGWLETGGRKAAETLSRQLAVQARNFSRKLAERKS
ncbi:hypothetical protein [Skermanella pratensis]|uniref:hypothetical protein n=1 Tax=Skermanella pratensis TaxID=2233999 RepID=UPI00130154DA|nr:hypothetical protein [Skermanella pratensis]